jgi:hypothetical protein
MARAKNWVELTDLDGDKRWINLSRVREMFVESKDGREFTMVVFGIADPDHRWVRLVRETPQEIIAKLD